MVNEKYQLWCEKAVADPDLVKELESMKDDGAAISDAFYKDLEFGTGGLRGHKPNEHIYRRQGVARSCGLC